MRIVLKRECDIFKTKMEENIVRAYTQHLSGSGQAPVDNTREPH